MAIPTPIGIYIADAMRQAADKFWFEWLSRYPDMSQDRKVQLQVELAALLEDARLWEQLSFDPSVVGHARAPFFIVWQTAVVAQTDGSLPTLPVAIWVKTGVLDTDWTMLWSRAGSLTLSTAIPLPDGVGSAGDLASGRATAEGHIHPLNPAPPPPALATSSLYTAKVGASLFRGDVYCAFMSYTSCVGAIFAGWTEVSPGVMQKDDVGPLSSALFDGMDVDVYNPTGISAMIGRTVFAFDVAIDDYSKTLTGPWIIDDVGAHYENYGTPDMRFVQTYARMHRAPDYSYSAAFVHGMQFQIDNGETYGGCHLTLNSTSVVLGTTAMDWSWTAGAPAASDEKWELLTGPQLTSEGALTDYLDMSVTSGAGLGGFADTQFPLSFTTLAGTPGVEALAVGPYTVDIESAAASGMDPGSIAMLRLKLIDVDNGNAVILIVDSPPVTASGSRPEPLHFVGAPLSSPYAFSPTRRLKANFYLRTNSISPVTMGVSYNSSGRGNKITLPFAMPISGAGDGVHDHLSGRDTVNNHFGVGTCTTVGGVIPTPTKRKMVVTVSGSTTLTEMGAAGLEDGVEIELVFLQACAILNGTTAAAGNAPFVLESVDGTPITSIDWTEPATALGRIGVTYYKTALPSSPCFLLTKGPLI